MIDTTNAEAKAFVERCTEEHPGIILQELTLMAGDAVRLVARRLELAKGDPAQLKNALESIKNFPALQGPPGSTHNCRPQPKGSCR